MVAGTVLVKVSVTVSCKSSVSVTTTVCMVAVGVRLDERASELKIAPSRLLVSVLFTVPVRAGGVVMVKETGIC